LHGFKASSVTLFAFPSSLFLNRMSIPAAGNSQTSIRRRLAPTYPSFALVMHRFWYFVQLPARVQPASSVTRRPAYDTNPQRINLAAETRDDNWAMRTHDGPGEHGTSSTAGEVNPPNTPQLRASPENAASKISLLNLGSP